MAARARAFFETERNDRPGGRAKAFCEPLMSTSMPSSSFLMGIALSELTVSTMAITSGNSRITFISAGRSLMQPQDVSLWMSVRASYAPVASSRRTASGSTGWPQSNFSAGACLPQRRATSFHLSENAPFMQLRTFFLTTLRIEPSITPQALLVER